MTSVIKLLTYLLCAQLTSH